MSIRGGRMPRGFSNFVASAKLATWMQPFSESFTTPTWHHVLVLVAGAVVAPGRRTVAAALRVTGLDQDTRFTNYHRVLNRNRWCSRAIARLLFRLLVTAFAPHGPVIIEPLNVDGGPKSAPVAYIAIRSAPRMATSSRQAGRGGSPSCSCPTSPGQDVSGGYRS